MISTALCLPSETEFERSLDDNETNFTHSIQKNTSENKYLVEALQLFLNRNVRCQHQHDFTILLYWGIITVCIHIVLYSWRVVCIYYGAIHFLSMEDFEWKEVWCWWRKRNCVHVYVSEEMFFDWIFSNAVLQDQVMNHIFD